jgi:hypothetical protein
VAVAPRPNGFGLGYVLNDRHGAKERFREVKVRHLFLLPSKAPPRFRPSLKSIFQALRMARTKAVISKASVSPPYVGDSRHSGDLVNDIRISREVMLT